MSYLANRMHFFFPLLGIKRQRDPMEPKQWELIIKPNLLIPSRAYGSKDKLGWQDHMQKLKQKRFQLVLFPKSHSYKKWAVFLFFFFLSLFCLGSIFSCKICLGSGSFQMCRCLWLHTSSLLGTITAVESKAIQSSISHCSTLLPSVKEVINGLMESSNDMDYTLPMQGLWF